MVSTVDPVKLCVQFEPPMLALLYKRSGGNRYLHEFPIPQDDLCEGTEAIYSKIKKAHPNYLAKIDPK
jgi:hypothetical protein